MSRGGRACCCQVRIVGTGEIDGQGSVEGGDVRAFCHVQAGDVVTMEPGSRHTVIAETEMKLFELQLGLDGAAVDKSDKTKYTEI